VVRQAGQRARRNQYPAVMAAPIVGALVLTALPHVIDVNAEARILIYGLILILTILLMPRGIVGLLLRPRRAA